MTDLKSRISKAVDYPERVSDRLLDATSTQLSYLPSGLPSQLCQVEKTNDQCLSHYRPCKALLVNY
ncbi:MAG TPA: hypothetical protein IGS53_26835 [Leptolyngbyaceae cyanobacterium M33_DOE_097]|uniref:Uncharacterized protein n=1 Tax=Oscillatoriales cyanobacterium SpSt-418 TaxID=2282169 RepID=A0A7C3PPZ7_9CYAN|nr:hypothetical protein [Leptolyngbyaceae cyanobacterium M33_DOE_097]